MTAVVAVFHQWSAAAWPVAGQLSERVGQPGRDEDRLGIERQLGVGVGDGDVAGG